MKAISNEVNVAGELITGPRSTREIAESVLGEIDWISATMGYCNCPGKKLHGLKDGVKDCAIYLDRVPTVSCFHGSCKEAVGAANKRLRAALFNPDGEVGYATPKLTNAEREALLMREKNARLQLRARKALPTILKRHRWPYDDILKDSPVNVRENEADHWKLLLGKFRSDDVVWLGERSESGCPAAKDNFRTVEEWLKLGAAPKPFICPATFKNTIYSRSNENVLERRFVVIESDLLTRNEVGAVFRYLMDCGMKLLAIVDTAGKSLHGWFEYTDDDELLESLRLILPALKCDPKMLIASQPARLPGAMRGDKRQRLIYLTKEEEEINQ